MRTTINYQINSCSSGWVEFPVYDDRCEDSRQPSEETGAELNHKNNSTLNTGLSPVYYLRMLYWWLAVRSQPWLGAVQSSSHHPVPLHHRHHQHYQQQPGHTTPHTTSFLKENLAIFRGVYGKILSLFGEGAILNKH